MDIYRKNMKALEKNHPKLVELIESIVIDEEIIKVLQSETGDPRILFKKEGGEEVFIHNSEDPSMCADQAVDLLGKMDKEGIAVLFGFGLGYFGEEIIKRFEEGHYLMVYEAIPELFKTALKTRDLSDLLESEKVVIILGEDMDNLSMIDKYHHHFVNGKFWIIQHQPSIKLNEEAYREFQKRLEEEKLLSTMNIGTAVNLGKEFINALMANVSKIIRKPGVKHLKDVFKGRPAIVVSGGPSLDKNLHLLNKVKGRAVIIAVDAVLPTLLPAGIVPDIIVAIDPLPENISMFKDNPMLARVPFICLSQYTPEIVSVYPGPIFMNSVHGNIVYQWLANFWEDKGYITGGGGSVAHLAFRAAEYMGADVIGLIGQDLSFDKKYHAGDTTKLLHAFHDEEVPDYTKGALLADDIFGEKRYTVNPFIAFKVSFEKMIKPFNGDVVNATEGGLPIKGATNMRFIDFIDEYCSNLTEIETFSILSEISKREVECDLDGLLFQCKGGKKIFMDKAKNAKVILKHINRLTKMKENKQEEDPEFNNILTKIEPLIENAKHPILNIITAYQYSLELYLKRQDMQEIDGMEDKLERLEMQLERGQKYYAELIEAVDLFLKQLNRLITSLEREAKIDTILKDGSIPMDQRLFETGMTYKRAGFAAQAVKYFEVLVEHQQSAERKKILLPLAEMYVKQFRFYEAKEILAESRGQTAKGRKTEKIDELLKVCNEKIRLWEERTKKTGESLERSEENYGSHLESGYFYFRANDFERAEQEYLKAVESHRSSSGPTDKSSLVDAYYGLAHTYLAIEDGEKAVEIFELAIEIDPVNPILYRDLGLIAFQNNNIESAELFLSKAIELAPADTALYKLLADLYLNIGQREKAIALYESALQANADNPGIQQNLALIYKEFIANAETG